MPPVETQRFTGTPATSHRKHACNILKLCDLSKLLKYKEVATCYRCNMPGNNHLLIHMNAKSKLKSPSGGKRKSSASSESIKKSHRMKHIHFEEPATQPNATQSRPTAIYNDEMIWHQLCRPRIHCDLATPDKRPLGRLIIRLYTEACPQVVLEFIRAFKTAQDPNLLKIMHFYPDFWLEAQLKLQESSLNMGELEYDMRTVDHGQSAGLLTFAPRDSGTDSVDNTFRFAIILKPLSVLNGRRIGFGRILEGLELLTNLQKYDAKYSIQDVIATNCGVF